MTFRSDQTGCGTQFRKNSCSMSLRNHSGMPVEHLCPFLDSLRHHRLFHNLAESLARGMLPESTMEAIRLGRMTALSKRDWGVRGKVIGDVVRRLVARTMAQQMGKTVESATAPFQHAVSTRAGCECIAHALQGFSDLDPNATIISIDGISGLLNVAGGRSIAVRILRVSRTRYAKGKEESKGIQ